MPQLAVGFPALGGSVVFDEVQPVIGPYDEPPVACRDFDPRAAEIARQVAGLISRHLPSLRAEHVGSTAVPGCGGRGIVDLLIACPEGDAEKVNLLLGRLGFRQGGEALFPPHPPAYRGAWVHNGEAFLLHVHVLPAGAAEVDSIRFLAELFAGRRGTRPGLCPAQASDRFQRRHRRGRILPPKGRVSQDGPGLIEDARGCDEPRMRLRISLINAYLDDAAPPKKRDVRPRFLRRILQTVIQQLLSRRKIPCGNSPAISPSQECSP